MQFARTANVDPRQFGRRPSIKLDAIPATRSSVGDDLKLFATTFAAGFVFVAVLLA